MASQGRFYLDHAATTPVLPEARAAMMEALARWHNPSSPHAEGRAARSALEDARRRIGDALGWRGEIIFTSGASEGLAIALGRSSADRCYISTVEHESVRRAAPEAQLLPVGQDGIVRLEDLEGDRPLVAVQHVNSETGVIQPLNELGAEVRAQGGMLLADCAQSAGKLPLPDADLLVLSAHKFGGPPGVGALLARSFSMLEAIGGQERGYRPGTENLPAVLAMAVALEAERSWLDLLPRLRKRLEDAIIAAGGEVVASLSPRLATIGSYRMPGTSSQVQLIQFDMAGVAVSAGSACSSGSLKPSHVLPAMGWEPAAASEVVRVSFGRSTSEDEIDRFAALWTALATPRRAA